MGVVRSIDTEDLGQGHNSVEHMVFGTAVMLEGVSNIRGYWRFS
jgi:hypothetical protein